jgi:hypothetical protein
MGEFVARVAAGQDYGAAKDALSSTNKVILLSTAIT